MGQFAQLRVAVAGQGFRLLEFALQPLEALEVLGDWRKFAELPRQRLEPAAVGEHFGIGQQRADLLKAFPEVGELGSH